MCTTGDSRLHAHQLPSLFLSYPHYGGVRLRCRPRGVTPTPHQSVAPIEWEFYGMLVKNQRLLILKMFEAFKCFIPTDLAQLCRCSRLGGTVPRPLDPTFSTNAWDWVHRFLWEIEEHCRRRGINKAEYASRSINYFVGSSPVFSTPNHNVSFPQPRKAPKAIPRASKGYITSLPPWIRLLCDFFTAAFL